MAWGLPDLFGGAPPADDAATTTSQGSSRQTASSPSTASTQSDRGVDTEPPRAPDFGSSSASQPAAAKKSSSVDEGQRLAVTRTLQAKDNFGVLGIEPPAPGQAVSPARLKRAYKVRCMELHPDRCHVQGAEEAFKRLQEAYSVLGQNPTASRKPKRSKAAAAAHGSRATDRTWTARGENPRFGAGTSRNRRPVHLDPAFGQRRANGRPMRSPPKAGAPPPMRAGRKPTAANASAAPDGVGTRVTDAHMPMGPLEA